MGYNGNSAWDIYRMADEMEAELYVDELRKAVYCEVQTGVCYLVEELIVKPSARFGYFGSAEIPVLPLFAIENALSTLENRGELQKLPPVVQLDRSGYYNWSDFNNHPRGNRAVDKISVNLLRSYADRYNRLCDNARKIVSLVDTNSSSAAVSYDKKVEKALEKARKEADRITEDAKREANRITKEANASASRIVTEATQKAERIRSEAELKIKDAQHDADKLRLEAQHDATELRKIAEEDAERIREAARQQAQEEAERNVETLTRQKLSAHIHELRRQWEEDQLENTQQRGEVSALAATLKEDACTVSTTVGAKLNRDLEQLQEQINQLRSNVTLDLQQWRASLYQCEYGKLVNFYNTLSGYANSFERELREAECDDIVSEEMKKVLREHSRKMNRLRNILIGAMEPMGLRTFTPRKGELFNSYYHATNDEEDDDVFLDHEIERCLKPGIERVVNDREVAVLLRASVEVRKDEQK